MTETGHGVQVLNLVESKSSLSNTDVEKDSMTHSFMLDEKALEEILLDKKVRDLPVVVVSVAGAYRTGKSFLLNFFLRYLKAKESDRINDSWLGDDSAPLVGFKWRAGIERTTTGILVWSEPIIMDGPGGNKVAVLLMDTQGAHDNTSTVRDNSTIFALSTLLSSVQIYNVVQNIQEDDLQHLQLFTEYGKLVVDNESKAFQVLEFLVRDWQCPQNFKYGAEGGEKMLQEKLKIDPKTPKELQELRAHIRSSFEKVSCFLMPHPGLDILEPTYEGNVSEIRKIFRTNLIDLVKSLFGSENLLPKSIHGKQVKAKELCQYFKTYTNLFTSGELPNPTSIMKATVEAGLLLASDEAREVYEKGMDEDCGPERLSVPAVEVPLIHKKYLDLARLHFTDKQKMGSKKDAEDCLEKLTKALDSRLLQFEQSNLSKIQTAMTKATEKYDAEIKNIAGEHDICVHATDLIDLHNKAVAAGLKLFDDSRKRLMIQEKDDKERDKLKIELESEFKQLNATNEQSHNKNKSNLIRDYTDGMEAKTAQDPPLSDIEFTQEHKKALDHALQEFESKRNIHSQYEKDDFKNQLAKAIEDSFEKMKKLNVNKNKEAIKPVLEEYKNFMKNVWDPNGDTKKFLHPSDLEYEHNRGMCLAISTYRPKKSGLNQQSCAAAFDQDDEGETLLKELIELDYKEIKSLNNNANSSAVTSAYNTYKKNMDAECDHGGMEFAHHMLNIMSLADRHIKHSKFKTKALSEFDEKIQHISRIDNLNLPTKSTEDTYRDNLIQTIDAFDRWTDGQSAQPPKSTKKSRFTRSIKRDKKKN